MEWLGVPLMVAVAALAAGTCNGIVRLLNIVAPVRAQDDAAQQGYKAE